LEEEEDPLFKPEEEDLEDKTRLTSYVKNYVNGDFDKLMYVCKHNGRYYMERWNFRIDENFIGTANLVETTISGEEPDMG
jgi:hypothetical protein